MNYYVPIKSLKAVINPLDGVMWKVDAIDPQKLMLAISKECAWFYDGNHRVAAAIVRGDDNVTLHIAESGEVDIALLLPGLKPPTSVAVAKK